MSAEQLKYFGLTLSVLAIIFRKDLFSLYNENSILYPTIVLREVAIYVLGKRCV